MNQIQNIANRFRAKTVIGGKEYSIKRLKAREGLSIATTLMKIAAPLIGSSMDGLRHDEFIHGSPKTFSDMATLFVGNIDNDVVLQVVDKLLEDLYVNENSVDFDEHFMSNYGELVAVVEFALKENFSSFFTENGIAARLKTTLETIME